jgi:hypothetical protein
LIYIALLGIHRIYRDKEVEEDVLLLDYIEKCENILAVLSLRIKALIRIIFLYIFEHILLLGTRPELFGHGQQDL